MAQFFELLGQATASTPEQLEEEILKLGGDSVTGFGDEVVNGRRVYFATVTRLRDEFRRKPPMVKLKATQKANPFYRLPNEWQYAIWGKLKGRSIRVPKELPIVEASRRAGFKTTVLELAQQKRVAGSKAKAFKWMRERHPLLSRADDRHFHRLIKEAPDDLDFGEWLAEDRPRFLREYLFIRSMTTDEFVSWMRGDDIKERRRRTKTSE